MHWTGTKTDWVETSPETFSDRKQKAINKCFLDVDSITEAAVGKRDQEYLDAQIEARAYKAAGYEGEVHKDVSSYNIFAPPNHPNPNQWAADAILFRADQFKEAKSAMREQRFIRQKAMQESTNDAELALPVAQWDGFINYLKSQLGV